MVLLNSPETSHYSTCKHEANPEPPGFLLHAVFREPSGCALPCLKIKIQTKKILYIIGRVKKLKLQTKKSFETTKVVIADVFVFFCVVLAAIIYIHFNERCVFFLK